MLKDLLNRRFACKHFDSSKPVNEKDLHEILDDARLSPSSFGLQAWQFMVITTPELKQKLQPACWNQPQITEAPVLILLNARTDLSGPDGIIKKYALKSQKDQSRTDEQSAGFEKYLTDTLSARSDEDLKNWTQKQTYLAAMTLMLSAIEKSLDTCPMEGFVPEQVSQILELPEYLHPTLIIPIGYRNMEQPAKTRFEYGQVVKFIWKFRN